MSSLIVKQIGNFGRVSFSGKRWSLVYCQACSVSCKKKDFGRKHSGFQASSVNRSTVKPSSQNWLFTSKYLIYPTGIDLNSQLVTKAQHTWKISSSHNAVNLLPSLAAFSVKNHVTNHYQYQPIRHIQTSASWCKEESKVEKTVKALKDSANSPTVPAVEPEKTAVVAKKSIWQKIVGVCKHYYHGFRLLAIDVKICTKLLWQLMNGKSLTRREYNQLVRTTADMFRLLPMLVFIIVPFAEFLLPFVLHFFPNMLPSTFKETDEKVENEKTKKTLKAKIEMAKFLQKTIKESAVEAKKQEGQTAQSFASFIDKIRTEGTKPSTTDIMKFAKLFEDEITLDNLSRQQLRACCIMLNVTPIGSDALLRFLLQMKLRGLRADDKMIQKEGIETLSIAELQAANRARGMRALGVSEERLREQMQQWLQLHLEEKIPTSLLLLSRTLYLPETLSTEEKIGATITQLAVTAADEAKIKVAEMSGEEVDNKTKLEIIKHEEAIIAAEKEQLAKEIKQLEEQNVRDMAEAKAAETLMESKQLGLDDTARILEPSQKEVLIDHAEVMQTSPSESFKTTPEITTKDLDEMESVLEEIAKERKINIAQDALKGLKDEVSEYKEDLEDLKDVAVVYGADEKEFGESKAARRLAKKVDRMISRLDTVVTSLQEEKSSIQEKISKVEKNLQENVETANLTQEQLGEFKSNIISINEMMEALKRLKKVPSDSKLQHIFQVLDQDKDGSIDINDALKVLEQLSQEHLKLSPTQLDEVLNLLKHEALLEEEERRKEKEEKEKREAEKQKEQL
ncbi:mitochondrial proton/calcium exchanger protein-like [Physella acuta]|uniref:mitochondrial proton/calcium exchanger protein-like n=1 Tax=Physella acuta TaxID=109671 RepID=UPI0027DBA7C7|nr:mitochondrial proton/calcium exchanger protein-like [Physella acuta]